MKSDTKMTDIASGTLIRNYEFLDKLSTDGSISTYRVRSQLVQSDFLAKVGQVSPGDRSFLPAESDSLMKLSHSHVTKIYDDFREDDRLFLIVEYCENGSVWDFVRTNGCLSKTISERVAREMCAALKYMLSHGVAHCDIRPQNVLLDRDLHAKLANFGMSRRTFDLSEDEGRRLEGMNGSFAAPEVVAKQTYDALRADIWSLGLTLVYAATGKTVWEGVSREKMEQMISGMDKALFGNMSAMMIGIVSGMLQSDPMKRVMPDDSELLRRHSLARSLHNQVPGRGKKLVRRSSNARSGVLGVVTGSRVRYVASEIDRDVRRSPTK